MNPNRKSFKKEYYLPGQDSPGAESSGLPFLQLLSFVWSILFLILFLIGKVLIGD